LIHYFKRVPFTHFSFTVDPSAIAVPSLCALCAED